jgi:glycosyltransferase involved in cell wall biosynthesis
MTPKKNFISVIVPVYNGGNFLQRCLEALFASDYAPFEVIVVDDGSTDESAAIARARGARVIESERPRSGPAAARNLAAKQAKGDVLLFVDADVVVKTDTLSKVADRFAQRPEISALFGSYDDEPFEKNFLSQYKNLQHHFVHQTSNSEASTFWAGLGAVRRDVFLSVGGFDCERYAVPSIEDIELGVRLRAAGHRILLDRDIQAKHLKKWKLVSLVRTEIFCRAVPWSKLILTSQGLINDMNLKTSDRASAVLVGLSIASIPLVFREPLFSVLILVFLAGILFLNRKIFRFFAGKKGVFFALLTYPWQCFYFFYSGAAFVCSWFLYGPPRMLAFGRQKSVGQAGRIN